MRLKSRLARLGAAMPRRCLHPDDAFELAVRSLPDEILRHFGAAADGPDMLDAMGGYVAADTVDWFERACEWWEAAEARPEAFPLPPEPSPAALAGFWKLWRSTDDAHTLVVMAHAFFLLWVQRWLHLWLVVGYVPPGLEFDAQGRLASGRL